MNDLEKHSTSTTESSSYLPIILGVIGGVLLVAIIIILLFWYKRTSKAKRTPGKRPNKKFKLQRQKTIEFELPTAPRLLATLPQVNYDRYDSTGKSDLRC